MKSRSLLSLRGGFISKLLSSLPLIFCLLFAHPLKAFEYKDYEKRIKTNYQVRYVVEKMPRSQIEEALRNFSSSARPNRAFGSVGHEKSVSYLEEKLKSYQSKGASFKKVEFAVDPDAFIKNLEPLSAKEALKIKNAKGVNLIWEKKGVLKPSEVLILGAHYDSVLQDPKTKKLSLMGQMPGADNNASGVGALLSLIEILDKLDLPKTVRVVFFDLEELGAQGSKNYAQGLSDAEVSGVTGFINVMMIGHDSRREDKEKKLNNMHLYFNSKGEAFGKLFNEAGKRHVANLDFRMLETNREPSEDAFPKTLESFQDKLPALLMTQNRTSDLNPRYRSTNDFVETLNFSSYLNIFKFLGTAVLTWNYDVVK